MNAMINTDNAAPVVRYGRKKLFKEPLLIESVDWQKYSVDQWLDQYGAWIQSGRSTGSKGCRCTLGALYEAPRGKAKRKPTPMACDITDNEARAIMRLIMEVGGWDAKVLIASYEYGMSLKAAAYDLSCSVSDVRFSLAYSKGLLSGRVGMFRGHE